MKNYFAVENVLYTLTNAQVKKMKKLFPNEDDTWVEYLDWICANGKIIGSTRTYNY